jgi:hypothetical protein
MTSYAGGCEPPEDPISQIQRTVNALVERESQRSQREAQEQWVRDQAAEREDVMVADDGPGLP